MHNAPRGRGRPRPTETITRDATIAGLLWRDRSLQEIADLGGLTSGQTYHALRRLQREGRVTTVRHGRRHLWTTTTHA